MPSFFKCTEHPFPNLSDFSNIYSVGFLVLGLYLNCSPTMKPRPMTLRRWAIFALKRLSELLSVHVAHVPCAVRRWWKTLRI